MRAALAARLSVVVQPIKFLPFGFIVAVDDAELTEELRAKCDCEVLILGYGQISNTGRPYCFHHVNEMKGKERGNEYNEIIFAMLQRTQLSRSALILVSSSEELCAHARPNSRIDRK